MGELLDITNAFTTPLKVAWVVWLVWGIGQIAWYRHERVHAMTPKFPLRRAARRTSRPSRAKSAEPIASRLITPSHVAPARKAGPQPGRHEPEPQRIAARPMFEPGGANDSLPPHVRTDRSPAPAFDPSKAVFETFDARDHRDHGDLDAIVADMERHMPRGDSHDGTPVH